ncbi:MAG: metallophosphoesterase [Planctomycetes bacterium]|nr:metallophosphoesterase [Planctomycetota bacterium]
MATKRLLTLLHISDTHIAEEGCQTGGDRIDPASLPRWRRGRVWHGVLSHSTPAMRALAEFAARLRDDEGSITVHSGDLTSWGAPGQFEAAWAILPEVLRDPKALDLAIPGNHDHWPGTGGVLGRPSAALRERFSGLPWVRHLPLGHDRILTIAAIDSDADVPPWSNARAWGRGHFQSQLAALDVLMPPRVPGEVRVLLMHHSPWLGRYHLGITRRSRAALETFLQKHGFRVILCGHVHRARGHVQVLGHGQVLEARCGSTTQRDCIPEDGVQVRHGIPQNTLIVHRLEEDEEGAVTWRSELFRHGLKGFESAGTLAEVAMP